MHSQPSGTLCIKSLLTWCRWPQKRTSTCSEDGTLACSLTKKLTHSVTTHSCSHTLAHSRPHQARKVELYLDLCCDWIDHQCFKPYDSETFENSSNSVELRLHLAPSYRLENGALQPMSIHQEGVTPLSFDRRKTVGDLRLSVYQVQGSANKIGLEILHQYLVVEDFQLSINSNFKHTRQYYFSSSWSSCVYSC